MHKAVAIFVIEATRNTVAGVTVRLGEVFSEEQICVQIAPSSNSSVPPSI